MSTFSRGIFPTSQINLQHKCFNNECYCHCKYNLLITRKQTNNVNFLLSVHYNPIYIELRCRYTWYTYIGSNMKQNEKHTARFISSSCMKPFHNNPPIVYHHQLKQCHYVRKKSTCFIYTVKLCNNLC